MYNCVRVDCVLDYIALFWLFISSGAIIIYTLMDEPLGAMVGVLPKDTTTCKSHSNRVLVVI